MSGGQKIQDRSMNLQFTLICKMALRSALTALLITLGATVAGCEGRDAETISSMPPSYGDLEIASYNGGQFDLSEGKLRVSGNANQGIFLNKQIDPKKKYILSVAGEDILGKASTRLTIGGDRTYAYVGKEGSQWTISGAEHLEVLFYADAPFTYSVDRISLSDCDACGTNDDLKNKILAEIPELDGLLKSDRYAAAVRLLDWASNEYVFAMSDNIIKTNSKVQSESAADLYFLEFQPRHWGGYCGAAAVFFEKILRLFDLDAFTVNFGEIQDDLTHVTVVLHISGDFFILDPSFNLQLMDKKGMPVSLTKMDWTDFSKVDFIEQPVPRRVFLVEEKDGRLCSTPPLSFEEDRFVCKISDWGVSRYLRDWKERMLRNGVDPSSAGFFSLLGRRIFSVGNNCTEQYCVQFLQEAKRRNVPVGMPG
jgi:hypothetical protein